MRSANPQNNQSLAGCSPTREALSRRIMKSVARRGASPREGLSRDIRRARQHRERRRSLAAYFFFFLADFFADFFAPAFFLAAFFFLATARPPYKRFRCNLARPHFPPRAEHGAAV